MCILFMSRESWISRRVTTDPVLAEVGSKTAFPERCLSHVRSITRRVRAHFAKMSRKIRPLVRVRLFGPRDCLFLYVDALKRAFLEERGWMRHTRRDTLVTRPVFNARRHSLNWKASLSLSLSFVPSFSSRPSVPEIKESRKQPARSKSDERKRRRANDRINVVFCFNHSRVGLSNDEVTTWNGPSYRVTSLRIAN